MIKLKQEVTYIENKTITGNKLIVGIKSANSYILIKNEYKNVFYSLIEKLKYNNILEENNLEQKEIELIRVFHNYGYIEGDKNPKKAFNEYNLLVKKFKVVNIPHAFTKELKNKNIFYGVYILFWIVGILILLFNWNYLHKPIQVENFKIPEIIFCLIVIPILIDLSHECGHFIIAGCLGIRASNVTIGFFVTWPTLYVRYEGLNLYSTKDKLCVTSAGIGVHILNTLIGLLLGIMGVNGNIISIWCIANAGMIITNLMFFGPSDGYFILTSLIGIYNLRYRGYLTLNNMLKRKTRSNRQDYLCATIVMGCWIWSFGGIYITLYYYGGIFNINQITVAIISILLIIILFIRFITNILRLETAHTNQ